MNIPLDASVMTRTKISNILQFVSASNHRYLYSCIIIDTMVGGRNHNASAMLASCMAKHQPIKRK